MNVGIQNARPEVQNIKAEAGCSRKVMRAMEKRTDTSQSNVDENSGSRIIHLMPILHVDQSIMVGTP